MAVSLVADSASLEPGFATDATSAAICELQYALGQGPGIDVVRTGVSIGVADLAAASAASRWPIFAPEAIRAGVRSLHSFPLGPPGTRIGEASLYRRRRGLLSEEQTDEACTVTSLLSSVLLTPGAGDEVGAELRMSVHRAAGMVMQQIGGSIDDALALIKATAFLEEHTVTQVAAEVLDGVRRYPPLEEEDLWLP